MSDTAIAPTETRDWQFGDRAYWAGQYGEVRAISDGRVLVQFPDSPQKSFAANDPELVRLDAESALTPEETEELEACEELIEQGKRTFLSVGNALIAIREKRLHRATHATFADYLQDRWDMGRAYAYQVISAATIAGNLSATADIQPETERQLRPLSRLEPEQQGEAWKRAVEIAGGGVPTSADVAQAAEEIAPRPKLLHPDDYPPEVQKIVAEQVRNGPDGEVLDYHGWEVGDCLRFYEGYAEGRTCYYGVVKHLVRGNLYVVHAREGGFIGEPPASSFAADRKGLEKITREEFLAATGGNQGDPAQLAFAGEEPDHAPASASAAPVAAAPAPAAPPVAKPAPLKTMAEIAADKAASRQAEAPAVPPGPALITFAVPEDLYDQVLDRADKISDALTVYVQLADVAAEHEIEPPMCLDLLGRFLRYCQGVGSGFDTMLENLEGLAAAARAAIEEPSDG